MIRLVGGLLVCLLVACGGDGGSGDAAIGVVFTSPAPGMSFTRDTLGDLGELVATLPIELAIDGTPSRVSLAIGTDMLADADPDGRATALAPVPGPATLIATAFDADGVPAATAQVDVVVVDPTIADCHGWLDLYRIPYTVGPSRMGVADPVTAVPPINGVPFRSGGAVRTSMFADCTLIKSLAEAAPLLRARQIVEVTDLGIYNYRCIGTGTPPNCPSGLSQHSFGNAIDLAAFKVADGTTYTVKTDWVIDPSGEKTCAAATEPGKDQFLHELICALKTAHTWNIVLTPNYNADHRDHFHVDLTDGSDFIRRSGR